MFLIVEAGTILINNPDPYDKRWKVMEFPDVRKAYVRFESPPDAQNINEKILIHLPNDPFLAENISNRPDGCYTVGDILLEDPPSSGRYSVLGRHDDTLVHINGEKTNPLPIEDIIRRSQFVEQVAIVGQNQFCPMALIQLNISESFNYTFKEIEDNISNYVELANKQSPSHSHILKELIYILPMKDILPRTEKGNLMRQKVNQEYSHLINQIYQEFFNKKEKKKEKNIYWTKQNIEKYLQDKLNLNQIKDLDYSKSIFQYGINSLQIIQLTNFICQDICEIEKDFLYEYSSIQQITEELIKYLNYQKEEQKEDNDPFHYQLTEQIIEKYIHLIKQNSNLINKRKLNEITERTFLITGANGSLANFIILHLLKQPKSIVKRIYCLLRGSDIKERFFQSFIQKKFDISILIKSFEEKRIILCQSMNLPDEYLGQTNEFYQELKDQLTDIIHLAWKINFNQTIKDFEYDSILGLYNLLKLSSFNSIQFHFISSISSAASGFLTNIKEKPLPRNSQIPLIQGYGQSKYAAEHISWAAMDLWSKYSLSNLYSNSFPLFISLDIPVNIYRVGQISGDTINGVWNKNEMAAMMIYAGAGQLKKMPNIGDDINWIPIDICSAAILDFILKSSFDISIKSDQRVYHILNPNSITYQQYLIYLKQAGLNFDIISNEEFIENILITNDQTNPLIKLSSFIQQRFLNKHLSKKSIFQTIKTVQQSQILQNCPQIDSNLIKLYLNYWKNIQLFEQIP